MSDEFIFERGIPLPVNERKGCSKWPLDVLEVGCSLKTMQSIGALRQAVRRFKKGKGAGRQFTTQRIGGGYVRCWRTK
jgi:hypothetical protein